MQHEYCPDCWPSDVGNYRRGRCLECAGHTVMADNDEYLNLVLQQNSALSHSLAEAMDMLVDAGVLERGKTKPPVLRVIPGRKP